MCDKAVDIHPSVIQFVPEFFKKQEMHGKAVNTRPFTFDSVPDRYKNQKFFFVKMLY